MNHIATKYKLSHGIGRSDKYLSSFDKALVDAKVGNYNLVRLSSILPAKCEEVKKIDLKEGSLLPTAYASITSDNYMDKIVSGIMIGFPMDVDDVGVIMEYSGINKTYQEVYDILLKMINEAFEIRNWYLKSIKWDYAEAIVGKNETVTTFACVSEW